MPPCERGTHLEPHPAPSEALSPSPVPEGKHSRRPVLLDLFCGAGGCAVGYHRAGFRVVGVDIKPQKRYPFTFVQADALEYVRRFGKHFDAIHASPPCQQYTALRSLTKKEYPDLLAQTRNLLIASGKPWVIENVPGAPLHYGVMLCGTMLDGLRVYRHRWFETSFWMWQPEHPKHKVLAGAKGTKGGRQRKAHYESGGFVTVAGDVGSYCGPAMGIDWMTGDELSQAIPPAYTEFIGRQLIRFFRLRNAALDGIPDGVRLPIQVHVVPLGYGDGRMTKLRRHKLDRRPGRHARRPEPMPDAVQRRGLGDAVFVLHPPQGLAQRPPRPAGTAGVDKDGSLGWHCALGRCDRCTWTKLCRCLCHLPQERNGLIDQSDDFRLLGAAPALVLVDDPHAPLQVHVRPVRRAQFGQAGARQPQEPHRSLERLVGQGGNVVQGAVWHVRPPLGLGVAHAGERVPLDALLLDGPVEGGADGVGFLPASADRTPLGMGFNPVGQVKRAQVGHGDRAVSLGEQAQGVFPFGTRGGAVDLFDLAVAQVQVQQFAHGQRNGGGEAKGSHGQHPRSTTRKDADAVRTQAARSFHPSPVCSGSPAQSTGAAGMTASSCPHFRN